MQPDPPRTRAVDGRVLKNTGFLAVSHVVTTLTGFCLSVLLARALGDAGVGRFAIVTTIAGALAIVADLPGPLLPLSAFAACMAATVLVLFLGSARSAMDLTSLLLGGIAVNAIAGAGTGLVIFLSDDAQLRALNFFTLGSLGGATWSGLWVSVPLIALPVLVMPWLASSVNALMLGEAEAGHLGVHVGRTKLVVVCVVAAGVGACVAVSGLIGFVGLAVPHLVRLVAGPDNRVVLPASALVGSALLVLADTLARTIATPAELPIGILTTLLGGPFFVWLLLRRRTV